VAEGDAAAPSEEELLEALSRVGVGDVLIQALVSTVSLAFAKLDPARRDLEQVRIAIEALRALVPVLEGAADEALLRDLESARSNLQLAYAKAVEEGQPEPDES